VAIQRRGIQFLRQGDYPPLRGTWVRFDDQDYLLYTQGYVPWPLPVNIWMHKTPSERGFCYTKYTRRCTRWPCAADGSRRKKKRPTARPGRSAASHRCRRATAIPSTNGRARRCARKLAEYTYLHARASRSAEITVTLLIRALGKCRRTVQRYLRILEREGYIRVDVIQSQTTRMCAGLLVHLLRPLFPQHHKDKWPRTLANPDATAESHKKNLIMYKGCFYHKNRAAWFLFALRIWP
jgi:hypothetical protein